MEINELLNENFPDAAAKGSECARLKCGSRICISFDECSRIEFRFVFNDEIN